jgi:hypothetical protein
MSFAIYNLYKLPLHSQLFTCATPIAWISLKYNLLLVIRISIPVSNRLFLDKCSPIPKLLTQCSNSVTKLTDRKIRWFISQKMKEILSTNDIALLQNVSGSRIRQIWCHYRITKTIPILAKPGRPSRNITNEEISAVIGAYKEFPVVQ